MQSSTLFRHIFRENRKFVRLKHKEDHWSVLKKKNKPVDKALQHFDDFYAKVFDKTWDSIRHALLMKQKYVAVVNNYSDSERICTNLENSGALNIRTLFKLEKQYEREKVGKYLKEKQMEEIHRLDRELDEKLASEEIEKVRLTDKEFSLESSLSKAEHDFSRIVDAKHANSSEILHQYVPATKIKGKEDWTPESDHYRYYEISPKFTIQVEKEHDLHFPDHLNIYAFEPNNNSEFPSPKIGSTGVYDYYLMDGGSVIPILALDIKPGHKVFDLCAAPGGKSLLAIQTLYPEYVLCNDVSRSRTDRIYSVFKQYLYDLEERWLESGRLKIKTSDGRLVSEDDVFDRILVDVPCTNDRLSLKENDNNWFKPSRVKERLKLPELQSGILFSALKMVKLEGVVVYATCSLSPVQNDGVIQMALKRIWEETKLEFVVKDLSNALKQVQGVYTLAGSSIMRYGHLVIPQSPRNFGPTYFCKLERKK